MYTASTGPLNICSSVQVVAPPKCAAKASTTSRLRVHIEVSLLQSHGEPQSHRMMPAPSLSTSLPGTALGYLSQMADQILQNSPLANEAATFASEVTSALEQHAVAQIA
jgi:hypothetical protein